VMPSCWTACMTTTDIARSEMSDDRGAAAERAVCAPTILVPWAEVAQQSPLPAAVYGADDRPPSDEVLASIEFYVMPQASSADRALIARMPRLQVLQTLNSGYDDVLPLLSPQTVLANGRGLRDDSVSEHALALILAQQRE